MVPQKSPSCKSGEFGRSSITYHLCLIAHQGLTFKTNLLLGTNKLQIKKSLLELRVWGLRQPFIDHPGLDINQNVFRPDSMDFSLEDDSDREIVETVKLNTNDFEEIMSVPKKAVANLSRHMFLMRKTFSFQSSPRTKTLARLRSSPKASA